MKILEYQDPPRTFDIFRARVYLATVYRVRYDWPNAFQEWVPRHLPRWLVYRTTIMAFSRAWQETNKHPDELTIEDVVKPWSGKSVK